MTQSSWDGVNRLAPLLGICHRQRIRMSEPRRRVVVLEGILLPPNPILCQLWPPNEKKRHQQVGGFGVMRQGVLPSHNDNSPASGEIKQT